MKIAAVSDIHVRPDGSDDALLNAIRDKVEKLSPEVFVIPGDISGNLEVLADSLSKLRVDGCANLFVAGNHDVWFQKDDGVSSLEKYSQLIGKACRENGFIHLPDQPLVIGDLAFVGSLGWYDYSFKLAELGIPDENYEAKEYRGAVWLDAFNIDWSFTDIEVTDLFNRRLEYDLTNLPKNVTRVVYVSHHLPFRNLTLYKGYLPWDFFSAFMGSEATGKILRQDQRVILSISGHSHIRMRANFNGLTAITVPIGYGRPSEKQIVEFVHQAVAEIRIDEHNIDLPGFVTGNICAGLPYVASERWKSQQSNK